MWWLKNSVRAAGLALAVLGASTAALRAEDSGLMKELSDLLRGSGDADKPAVEPKESDAPTLPAQAQTQARRVPFGREEMQLSFAPLVKATTPAVVNVYASQTASKVRSPFADDPFFQEFFGGQLTRRARSSLGSGVIVDGGGWIVTNFHVIKDADQIKVAISDGREFPAKVALKDESLDLAVLKVEAPTPFPKLAIGDSDALEVGDLVLAIGDPFGVGQTTTSGIVSGLARTNVGQGDFSFFIQTDAAINPGNSGGALIDMSGRLIGINTSIYSRSGGNIGIGFAIPSNIVRAVAASAIRGETYFERPFVGATFEPVTAEVAEALGLDRPQGALIAGVLPDGPAAKAGLKAGDAVLAMNGAPIQHVDALGYRLATQTIGAKAELTVLSGGVQKSVSVVLERAPEGQSGAEVSIGGRSPFAGIKAAALSPRLAQRLGLHDDVQGVAVVDIQPGSPADQVGFHPRDIVREVNGEAIASAEALEQAASETTRRWSFTIERDGKLLRQRLSY